MDAGFLLPHGTQESSSRDAGLVQSQYFSGSMFEPQTQGAEIAGHAPGTGVDGMRSPTSTVWPPPTTSYISAVGPSTASAFPTQIYVPRATMGATSVGYSPLSTHTGLLPSSAFNPHSSRLAVSSAPDFWAAQPLEQPATVTCENRTSTPSSVLHKTYSFGPQGDITSNAERERVVQPNLQPMGTRGGSAVRISTAQPAGTLLSTMPHQLQINRTAEFIPRSSLPYSVNSGPGLATESIRMRDTLAVGKTEHTPWSQVQQGACDFTPNATSWASPKVPPAVYWTEAAYRAWLADGQQRHSSTPYGSACPSGFTGSAQCVTGATGTALAGAPSFLSAPSLQQGGLPYHRKTTEQGQPVGTSGLLPVDRCSSFVADPARHGLMTSGLRVRPAQRVFSSEWNTRQTQPHYGSEIAHGSPYAIRAPTAPNAKSSACCGVNFFHLLCPMR